MQIVPNIQIIQYICEIVQNVPNVQPIPWCWPQNLQCGPAAPPYDQWKFPTSSERLSSPWSLPYLSTPPPYTCPKEERPNWDSWFILCKTCVLCASVDPTFIFWGKKLYSLLSDGVFTISVQTTTTIARRGIWTLNRHIWTYKLLLEQHQDHWSYIFETGVAGRWKSYFVTYFKVSHIYAAKQCSDKMWVLIQGKESKRATFNAGKFFPSLF